MTPPVTSSVPHANEAYLRFRFGTRFTKNYQDGKAIQEERTDSSIGVQSWNITDLIAQLDTFLLETEPDAAGTVREAHPEVWFWALNDETATEYSKTQQPAGAFWERVEVLNTVDDTVAKNPRDAESNLDADMIA